MTPEVSSNYDVLLKFLSGKNADEVADQLRQLQATAGEAPSLRARLKAVEATAARATEQAETHARQAASVAARLKAAEDREIGAAIDAAVRDGRIAPSDAAAFTAYGETAGADALSARLGAFRSTLGARVDAVVDAARAARKVTPAEAHEFRRIGATVGADALELIVGRMRPLVSGPGSAPTPPGITEEAIASDLADALQRAGLTADDYRKHGQEAQQ